MLLLGKHSWLIRPPECKQANCQDFHLSQLLLLVDFYICLFFRTLCARICKSNKGKLILDGQGDSIATGGHFSSLPTYWYCKYMDYPADSTLTNFSHMELLGDINTENNTKITNRPCPSVGTKNSWNRPMDGCNSTLTFWNYVFIENP